MNEQFAVIEGIVGSNAQGLSIHQHPTSHGQHRYSAYIGLRDGSRLIWQEIEMSHEQVTQFDGVLVSGNTVKVSGLLKKQLGLPYYRIQVDHLQLIRASEPTVLVKAA
jgi:hypothetical protein